MLKKVTIVLNLLLIMTLSCSKNQPPVINSISITPTHIYPNDNATLIANADDPDGDELTYTWSATSGNLSSTFGQIVEWKAPSDPGFYTVTVVVEDDAKAADTASQQIEVDANPDTEPPSVTLTYPANNDTITQAVITLTADATDNIGVSRVEFYVDNEIVGTDSTVPYTCSWSIASYQNYSAHSIFAKACDNANNIGQSDIITVVVVNRGNVWNINYNYYPIYDFTWTYDPVDISGAPSQSIVDTVFVWVDITHSYPSDLIIQLRSPSNNVLVMWDRNYPGGFHGYETTYFSGETVNGTWTVEIYDAASADEGYINECEVNVFWRY